MPIVAVLDLQAGRIVRGIAGRRDEYRPIASALTRSSAPLDVACAIRARYELGELYLADLDAIGGAAPNQAVYAALHQAGFRLWVDAGVRGVNDAGVVAALGVATVVVGLETVGGPEALAAIGAALGWDRVVFSLDLKDGQPLGEPAAWGAGDADAIAQRAALAGVTRLLVLDLARVGGTGGVGTEALCQRMRQRHPGLVLAAGGGVRGAADVVRLRACGVRDILVASALHDGRLTRDEVRAL